MNRGIIEKAWRESSRLTWVLGIALFLTDGLIAYVAAAFQEEIRGAWAQIGLVEGLLKALLGSEIGERIGPHVFDALPWVHPIVLSIIWAYQLCVCSRLPAGEIDRGTIDVLLGLPVSRWQVYLAETLVFLVSGLAILAMGVGGISTGELLSRSASFPAVEQVVIAFVNGFCLYLAVGGITYFCSALSDRRGRAVGWALAVVMSSFLLSFLAGFWEPAKSLVFLSFLNYYRPAVVFQGGGWPLGDMAILFAIGVVFWTAAGVIFDRRDIRTV